LQLAAAKKKGRPARGPLGRSPALDRQLKLIESGLAQWVWHALDGFAPALGADDEAIDGQVWWRLGAKRNGLRMAGMAMASRHTQPVTEHSMMMAMAATAIRGQIRSDRRPALH